MENVRPRFYSEPVRTVMRALDDAWEAAQSGAVEAVAVVGSGGAGKSRVVEEFSLEVRRRGDCVVAAKQANTLDYPRRLFANLLVALTSPEETADLADCRLPTPDARERSELCTRRTGSLPTWTGCGR